MTSTSLWTLSVVFVNLFKEIPGHFVSRRVTEGQIPIQSRESWDGWQLCAMALHVAVSMSKRRTFDSYWPSNSKSDDSCPEMQTAAVIHSLHALPFILYGHIPSMRGSVPLSQSMRSSMYVFEFTNTSSQLAYPERLR